ncbi:hypothetical protein P152DRAFT_458999 [Eremomyces bilateralis CBS 781.70]|uniref:Uncharacterized protein n=1 Tax=Eremomyces bilateralis CBS 781.70 TaxID=1392243 RepID=A0A6G1G1Q7_9PEZI|nr:uncharacterized protein P152DRAFT_458999 [Eremomyces bilateralis CBS 781.70]KAF1812045.1 hypothetical protein P152DRAFT_458999 [Eremomyces bilateralis CBS 781.70]
MPHRNLRSAPLPPPLARSIADLLLIGCCSLPPPLPSLVSPPHPRTTSPSSRFSFAITSSRNDSIRILLSHVLNVQSNPSNPHQPRFLSIEFSSPSPDRCCNPSDELQTRRTELQSAI